MSEVFGVEPPTEPDALCAFCGYPLDTAGRCPAAQAGTEQIVVTHDNAQGAA